MILHSLLGDLGVFVFVLPMLVRFLVLPSKDGRMYQLSQHDGFSEHILRCSIEPVEGNLTKRGQPHFC